MNSPSSPADFEVFADAWTSEVRVESNMERIFSNENYLKLLMLGPQAIPLMLSRLSQDPFLWATALGQLTGLSVGSEARNQGESVTAWRTWALGEGYPTYE